MNAVLATAIPILMAVIGGLGIFMLGMKYMSEGMQAVAGNSLRRLISLVTDNRVLAVGAGTLVTMLVQSSSVTTVIVVGLVNAGLMQLHQAIGVIVGANIGTTITGWILVLKIGDYGLPLLGIGALVYLFTRKDRPRFIAMAVMGLGMIFFGLELMKDGFAPLAENRAFIDAFAWFRADSYTGVLRAVLVGCILTVIVQSSSATLGITIGLASTGVIPFTTAAALVLGENIGTTITAVLASLGATTEARRAAYGHVLFNVFGVLWITAIFQWYIRIVSGTIESVHGLNPMLISLDTTPSLAFATVITAGIALTHTGFNVANTLMFVPFLPRFSRLLERIVPEPEHREVSRLLHLDARGVDSPVLGVEQSRGEVVQMAQAPLRMMDWVRTIAFEDSHNQELIEKTFHREQILDNVQREIVQFLTEVLDANVPYSVAEEGRQQFRIAHEYESISDRIASVLKSYIRLRDLGVPLPEEPREQLKALHDEVASYLRRVTEAYANRTTIPEEEARAANDAIANRVRALREEHLRRMTEGYVDANLSLIFTTLLTEYRRIRAHTTNIHQAATGTKAVELV
ncbi:MAG: Na/Pi cotransporter family protein [Candidatus Cloacimonetes bacterium]|nr:Na/Pi cotransporter family protein [Candidatus Cloacimonadota bacterium]